MFTFELICRSCRWRTVCGAAEAASRLRLIGLLRREKEPDEATLAELLIDAAPRMTCPTCRAKGTLRAARTGAIPPDSGMDGEYCDDGDWQAAVLCEICRQPIPLERLEALPQSRRCVACQNNAETGTLADDEPEFCPNCGALVELRVSRGAGITRYKRFCTNSPPCRL